MNKTVVGLVIDVDELSANPRFGPLVDRLLAPSEVHTLWTRAKLPSCVGDAFGEPQISEQARKVQCEVENPRLLLASREKSLE
jgi:hypothetical protein